ncbi:MAG TPA: alpha/beta hydrolase [Leptospiraceae bacterium]|nr:alpha/beta hydrolase [Leptospiraceae bacterium]HMY68486.1 alpha/beta hydrolase [Leptospiraceae bacterium]HMZ62369.1 alpha/beta hydrolase [Leptospiraceae bacterium]HNF14290.1 alpha/beta hydrolase [Leptospiraceae bacterium]HNI97112.1 alpha/beta hydrolase [Leptospiraceae bacterium]
MMNRNIKIVFLHGFPLTHKMWKEQFYFQDKYNVQFPDLPGAGQFSKETVFTVEDMADRVIESLADYEKIVPVGLSMGGYVAMRIADRIPERLAGLVLMDTRAEADPNPVKLKRAGTVKFIRENGADPFLKMFIPDMCSESTRRNQSLMDFLFSIAAENTAEGLSSQVIALQGRMDSEALLSKIGVPTLVLAGAQDLITPKEGMKLMSDKIPGSEFHIIENAGHLSPIERPDIVNPILEKFLGKFF